MLLFIQLLAALGLTASECPFGSMSNADGTKCFHVITVPLDFHTGQSICSNFGGNLASVGDEKDNRLLQGVLAMLANANRMKVRDFWIGGSDENEKNAWSWQDEKPFGFVNWGKDEPGAAHCASINAKSGKWKATSCDAALAFVCETEVRKEEPCADPEVTTVAPTTESPTTELPVTTESPTTAFLTTLLTATLEPTTPEPCPVCPTLAAPIACPENPTMAPLPTRPGPDNWARFGNHFYGFFFDQTRTWQQARSHCLDFGAHLASITSAEENEFLFHLTRTPNAPHAQSWLGGRSFSRNMEFVWTDGSQFDYTAWMNCLPKNYGSQNCVYAENTAGAKWGRADCNSAFHTVCKMSVFV